MKTTAGARAVVWSSLAIAVLANIAGYVGSLYARWAWFDKALHCYTIGALTLALSLALYGRALTGARDRRLVLILVIAAVGLGIGARWEIAEWGYDRFTPGNAIKGKDDTITDLIADALGALIAGAWASALAEGHARRRVDRA